MGGRLKYVIPSFYLGNEFKFGENHTVGYEYRFVLRMICSESCNVDVLGD